MGPGAAPAASSGRSAGSRCAPAVPPRENPRVRCVDEAFGGATLASGYCVKCKATREIKDAQPITMKNGRPATQGVCPVCGTKIFKIGAAA